MGGNPGEVTVYQVRGGTTHLPGLLLTVLRNIPGKETLKV